MVKHNYFQYEERKDRRSYIREGKGWERKEEEDRKRGGRRTDGGAMMATIPIIGNSKPLHVHIDIHLERAGH